MLLLPAAVRHRVPNVQICCWFVESDPSVFFLFIQRRFIFDRPPWQYCCVAFTALICPQYILGNYGHTWSQGGRQLPVYTYITMYKSFFFAHWHFFLFRPLVFSHALGSGTRREPARTRRRKCGPCPRFVERALGVQSRK